MDPSRRELLVARISAGSIRLKIHGKVYVARRPTRDHLHEAAELYAECLEEGLSRGLYADEELLSFLLQQGFWDEDREELLNSLPKEVENFKVALYENTFKSNERKVIRKALATAKAKLEGLAAERHAYDHLAASGYAAATRTRYLVGVGLHSASGRVYPDGDDFWLSESGLLDEVLGALASARLSEAELRELARTEPWRSTWSAAKVEGSLFGVPACDYTDEQRALVGWSGLYDGVLQHPQCPPDEAVNDDDLLDGWLILRRREREAGVAKAEGEGMVGEKTGGKDEVYIPAETAEDAKKVLGLNDQFSRATLKSRFDKLRDKGKVNELDMPDTALRLRMEITKKLMQGSKGG